MPTTTKPAKAKSNDSAVAAAHARPGYKLTKLGWLPVEWDVVPFAKAFDRVKRELAPESGTLYREIGIRSHGKGLFYKEPKTGEQLGEKSVYWVEPDCLVFNIVFAWEQSVARTTITDDGLIASHRFPMYRAKEDLADLDFVLYFLKTKRGKLLLEDASPGGAGRNKTLSQGDLNKSLIPFPAYREQRRIAAILGTWDKAIATLGALISAKQRRKQGLMQELLSGKRRLSGRSPIADPKHPSDGWIRVELSEFVRRSTSKYDPTSNGPEIPIIELEHIESETGRLLGRANGAETVSMKNRFVAGQVLFGKLRPYLRKFLRPDFDGACSSEIWVLDGAPRKCDNSFLHYLVQGEHFIAACGKTSGSKMPRADWGLVTSTPFLFPPIDEQREIGTTIRLIERETQLLTDQLAHLTTQKRGLMQQLLTGQIRVKA